MKKIITLALMLIALGSYAQKAEPVNYILVYIDSVDAPNKPVPVSRVEGFATAAKMNEWLNDRGLDSTQVVGVYNVGKIKPLAKGYTEQQRQKVEVVRERKWAIKP